MFLDTLEKIRKQPLAVRQQVMFLVTLVAVMIVTVLWAVGYFLTSTVFKEPTTQGPPLFDTNISGAPSLPE